METTVLVVVDGQNDFLDHRGSLCIPGARDEAVQLSESVLENVDAFDDLVLTEDLHYEHDIAHTRFWRSYEAHKGTWVQTKGHPKPFTNIYAKQVKDGIWIPVQKNGEPFNTEYFINYLEEIESKGVIHTIWEDHCVVGTWGAKIHPVIARMVRNWEDAHDKPITIYKKGQNPMTESFSAIRAIVPNSDERTQTNHVLLDQLSSHNRIVWCGWAGSHCLPDTVTDAIQLLPYNEHIILQDITAPVTGFTAQRSAFLQRIRNLSGYDTKVITLLEYSEGWNK